MTDKRKTGPTPERVKINLPWEQAIAQSLKKPRPPDGWHKHQEPKKMKPG